VLRLRFLIFFVPAFLICINIKAQQGGLNKKVQYETIYDDPYDINKLFLMIQPVYGEVYSTNGNLGFGLGVEYYLKDLMDFQIGFRTPYSQATDLMRDAAIKNSDALTDQKRFYYTELGLNYHVVDRKQSSKSKFVLFSKNFKKYNKWETMVPETIFVPINIRKIWGVRLGGTAYRSTFDFNRVMENQGKELGPDSSADLDQVSFYSNINSQGFYVGGSLELIKNVAIKFENLYDPNANDLMFNVYLDLLINPFISIEDITFIPESGTEVETISGDIIDTSIFGFRAGIQGKFNRGIGFSYGVETGLRPGIQGSGFYLMGVFSVPVFGFRLDKGMSNFEN
jgi:hypothetical protein